MRANASARARFQAACERAALAPSGDPKTSEGEVESSSTTGGDLVLFKVGHRREIGSLVVSFAVEYIGDGAAAFMLSVGSFAFLVVIAYKITGGGDDSVRVDLPSCDAGLTEQSNGLNDGAIGRSRVRFQDLGVRGVSVTLRVGKLCMQSSTGSTLT